MDFKPSKRYISLLRLRLTAAGAVLCFINGAVYYFGRIPALIMGVGIFVLFVIAWVWYIPHFVKTHGAALKDDVLCVSAGVIIKTKHILPNKQCIYLKRAAGPIFRVMGLVSVQIKLTRGVVTIHGLSKEDALLLEEWGKND